MESVKEDKTHRRSMVVSIALALLVGILIGFGMNMVYFNLTRPTKSLHHVTSFILVSHHQELSRFKIAYSYPIIYNETSPSFTINSEAWRVKWEVLPYFNQTFSYAWATVYFALINPSHYNPVAYFRVWGDREFVGLIEIHEPSMYNVTSMCDEIRLGNLFYIYYSAEYISIRGSYTLMTEKGTYYIQPYRIVGCFNFTIEEYY
jgi:hypothetical protein